MILQALCELAEREGLTTDPDYQYKGVAWIVRVTCEGRLVGIEGTHQERAVRGKAKTSRRPKSLLVPRQSGRSGTRASAYFFVDNAKYVFGKALGAATFDETEGREKARLFSEMVEACAEATSDEGARGVARFLRRVREKPGDVVLPDEVASNELFAFALGTVPELVHERPAVRRYWASLRTETPAATGAQARCLVTGAPVGEPGLVEKIKGVPGTNPSGAAIVSFNQRAFDSHGWTGNQNAPISRAAAEAVSTALNRLLAHDYPDPRNPEDKLGVRNVRLGPDTVVVFWSGSRSSDASLDTLVTILSGDEPDAGRVADLYQSIWSGFRADLADPSSFFALTLSGAQGRVMVRGWLASTVEVAVANVSRHFADLSVVRGAKNRGGGELGPPSLRTLLESLAPPGTGGVPASLAAGVVHAALTGQAYPLGVLQRALLRGRAEAGKREWVDTLRRDSRAALIKSLLIRCFERKVSRAMDRTNTAPGYVLGRLMAVIERMQEAAMGEVNASVVDRYFSGASATPAVVFPRLLKNMRNHARKAKDDDRAVGVTRWLESEADSIVTGLSGFPAYLNLEQQGFFVLGYHQERHWLWLPKDQRAGDASVDALPATAGNL